MTWWLDNNMPHSPEKMDEIFRILATTTIEATFGRKTTIHQPGSIKAFYALFVESDCCPEK